MKNLAIKAENISKQYRLGLVGTGTIRDDLKRWSYRIRGKEDPFLKIGEANDRSVKGESDYVWSLKDINFEINQGDSVGIIGRNGAGKSTLLKILSQVTQPTTGKIYTKGRIASLLEVGTGFHPEMTGRENIYLNGAILGMRKHEIDRKFDEIVDFSGVERYIDTPVKRYSSGMYVRLAFAVAAHLESEILIVDEVLAVGDAEFQKKCLGKMGDVSKGEGRTVLFVSHNMGAIKSLCDKSIFLKKGIISLTGHTSNVISGYLNDFESSRIDEYETNDGKLKVRTPVILDKNNKVIYEIDNEYDIIFLFDLQINRPLKNLVLGIAINDLFGNRIITFHSNDCKNIDLQKVESFVGNHSVMLSVKNVLAPGNYRYTFGVKDESGNIIRGEEYTFSVFSKEINKDGRDGLIWLEQNWSLLNK